MQGFDFIPFVYEANIPTSLQWIIFDKTRISKGPHLTEWGSLSHLWGLIHFVLLLCAQLFLPSLSFTIYAVPSWPRFFYFHASSKFLIHLLAKNPQWVVPCMKPILIVILPPRASVDRIGFALHPSMQWKINRFLQRSPSPSAFRTSFHAPLGKARVLLL